jgi:hypothetical protein
MAATTNFNSPRTRVALAALIGIGSGLGIAACTGKFFVRAPTDGVGFSHQRHAQAKVECIACHEKLYDATALGDPGVFPKEAVCLQCHKEKKETGNCGFCHADPGHPTGYAIADGHLKLNHAAHIDRVKEDCSVCHASLSEPGHPKVAPTMNSCFTCHEHKTEYAEARCDGCHKDLSRYPLQPVASLFSHQANFVQQHANAARSGDASCALCHEQSFCTDCHAQTVPTPIEIRYPERVASNFIHRNDYLSRHSIEAAADPAMCQRCHANSFCQSCHIAQNLTPNAANPRSPHPPGFSFPGPNSHALPARRDIVSCAACHDQGPASICISCHKVGGVGGDPHPMGWSNAHPQSEIHRNSMCLYCHL